MSGGKNLLWVWAFKFYYVYSGILNRILPYVKLAGKRIYVAPNVYKPLENEHRLADTCQPGGRVLDLGCGSGVTTVFAAAIAKEVVATDISPAAVENVRRNCELHKLTNVVPLQSDMFDKVDGLFDLIITHPPYFEVEMEGDDAKFATSVKFLDVLFRETKDYLTEGGRLLVQYPDVQQQRLERMGETGGLKLVDSFPASKKSFGLLLTSLLYLQFGNHSRQYFFERS